MLSLSIYVIINVNILRYPIQSYRAFVIDVQKSSCIDKKIGVYRVKKKEKKGCGFLI